MNSEMVLAEQMGSELTGWQKPEDVLAQAQQAAAALGRVISMKPNPVIFNKEQYLELEDWQTVGRFYGLTTKVESTQFCDYGGVTGWEAVAVCIDKDGREVSRAESMCMTDEENWGDVPEYRWEDLLGEDGKKIWDPNLRGQGKGGYKARKIEVGRKPKPMFQLRSMAQTRACGKAFRQVLSWVVVLGGFKPNVAEEMIDAQLSENQQPAATSVPDPSVGRRSEKAKAAPATEPQQQQQPAAQAASQAAPSQSSNGAESRERQWSSNNGHDPKLHINFKQGNLMFIVQGKAKVSDEAAKLLVKNVAGADHRNLIPKDKFGKVLDALDPEFAFHEKK